MANSASDARASEQELRRQPIDILSLEINLPPLPIQRPIADILSAYDDQALRLKFKEDEIE